MGKKSDYEKIREEVNKKYKDTIAEQDKKYFQLEKLAKELLKENNELKQEVAKLRHSISKYENLYSTLGKTMDIKMLSEYMNELNGVVE